MQPRLPKFKREKKPEEPGKKEDAGVGFLPKSRILWLAVAVAAVVVILIVLWAISQPQPQAGPIVTDSQVLTEMARLQEINSNPKSINTADYPKTFGIYARNNLTLVEQYFCSDVCPDYGRVYLVYQGVDNEECLEIGEESLHDLAWGGYIGCAPKVE